MPTVRDQLVHLLALPGVRAVVLAGREGLTIDAMGQGEARLFEALGALGASALGTSESLGQELGAGAGAAVGVILEYEGGLVSVDPVGPYAALVTLAESAASLGRLRHALATARGDLLRALDTQ
ncbi:MAG TPA: roadblock/LC7 domain-containing protein [Ktedonobacterales bacterium]|jgi:hypothetical protein